MQKSLAKILLALSLAVQPSCIAPGKVQSTQSTPLELRAERITQEQIDKGFAKFLSSISREKESSALYCPIHGYISIGKYPNEFTVVQNNSLIREHLDHSRNIAEAHTHVLDEPYQEIPSSQDISAMIRLDGCFIDRYETGGIKYRIIAFKKDFDRIIEYGLSEKSFEKYRHHIHQRRDIKKLRDKNPKDIPLYIKELEILQEQFKFIKFLENTYFYLEVVYSKTDSTDSKDFFNLVNKDGTFVINDLGIVDLP